MALCPAPSEPAAQKLVSRLFPAARSARAGAAGRRVLGAAPGAAPQLAARDISRRRSAPLPRGMGAARGADRDAELVPRIAPSRGLAAGDPHPGAGAGDLGR